MRISIFLATLCALLVASCAQSLEQIVKEGHQQRIDQANANNSISGGAADGLGSYIATSPH